MKLKKGDIVARLSYACDLLFRIVSVHSQIAILAGEDIRLLADAPVDDLVIMPENKRRILRQHIRTKEDTSYHLFRQDAKLMKRRSEYEVSAEYEYEIDFFEMRGRILHIDGDPMYLRKCMELYEKLGVPVYGVHMEEKEMPAQIESLLQMVKPDIVVITGHDAYVKTKAGDKSRSYRHTKYFAECVRIARNYTWHRDELVIFAGACQSHFETLMKAGANFASSPKRVNIHALDPVYIAARISLTSFMERVHLLELLRNTITGKDGIGGIETKGTMRRGVPYIEEDELAYE